MTEEARGLHGAQYEAIVSHCQAGGEVAELCARLLPAAFRQVKGGGERVVALGDRGSCLQ